jgi:hypothetical protein
VKANHQGISEPQGRSASPRYPKYAPLPEWRAISGLGRSKSYELLGEGKLRAIKVGRRLLIDVEHGLEYLATMPAARISLARCRKAT